MATVFYYFASACGYIIEYTDFLSNILRGIVVVVVDEIELSHDLAALRVCL